MPRSRRTRAVDATLARVLKLPKRTHDHTRTSDLRIPMRDGTTLLADHLAPVGASRGTVLIRGPYGFNPISANILGGLLAAYGFDVVLGRTRGTFGSGGAFDPFAREVEDGADTVAWLRQQPFFTGTFATFGGSYLGYTQWALLMDPPPELATAVMQVAPHDISRAVHAYGAFNLDTFLSWADQVSHQADLSLLKGQVRAATAAKRQAPFARTLPVADAASELCQGRAPWFRDWATRRDVQDPFWSPLQLHAALDRVNVPVLLQTGWQDLFLDQTLTQYEHLRDRGVEVGLTVGPWHHQGTALHGYQTLIPEALDWLATHLEGKDAPARPGRVRIKASGSKRSWALPDWPPAGPEQVLHLQPGGGLGSEPATGAASASFTYDPADPTTPPGGRALDPKTGGYKDDTKFAQRPDVLAFTGPALKAPLTIIGVPAVELAHRSDNPHADVFVRISEVDAKGRSQNVTDGFVRLTAADQPGVLRLELDPTAHEFRAGSRIRLLVAGGCFPRFDRNLGTGNDPGTDTATAVSHRSIELQGSRLVLPVHP